MFSLMLRVVVSDKVFVDLTLVQAVDLVAKDSNGTLGLAYLTGTQTL